VARGVSARHRGRQWGIICHGKLPASLLVIILLDLALRTSRGVSSFLEPLMPIVHQWGIICHGKLPASLLVIIRLDLALRVYRGVSSFLEPLMPTVHQ
jgi:hypothetical protein